MTKKTTMTLAEQLRTVFCPQLRFITVTCMYMSLLVNIFLYGMIYESPQILESVSTIPPAKEMIIALIPGFVACAFGGATLDSLPKKVSLFGILTIFASSSLCFCVGGTSVLPRSVFMELLFQYGIQAPLFACPLGYILLFQLAVELYPTGASATGGSVIIGFGRIGAIIASPLFEAMRSAFGSWTAFNILLMILSMAAVPLVLLLPMRTQSKDGPEDAKLVDDGCAKKDYSAVDGKRETA